MSWYHSGTAVLIACALIATGSIARAQQATDKQPTRLAYVGAKIFEPATGTWREGHAIVVEGEKISSVTPAQLIVAGDDYQVIDVRGRYIVPGLINTHVHLAHYPDRRFALAQLERDLYSGVTAVRSMGDDARAIADLARGTRLGELTGPDIVYAALFAGPAFFHDERMIAAARGETPGKVPWLRAVSRDTDLGEAVTLARGSGASAIKIYGNLATDVVRRLAREAHRQGLAAWAHAAVFPASPLDVARAGVDSMSHVCMIAYQGQAMPQAYHGRADVDESRFADSMPGEVTRVFEAMREHGVVLDATNYVYDTIERMRAEMPEGQGPPIYCSAKLADRLTAEAHRVGVAVSVGTDAFSPVSEPYSAVQDEIEIFVRRAGFTPAQALSAATLIGARALGRESDMGSIAADKLANFVVLSRDPTRDIAALRAVEFTVKRGHRYPRADYVPMRADDFGAGLN
jgi:imidazolonepropionase-like amidohydrolase